MKQLSDEQIKELTKEKDDLIHAVRFLCSVVNQNYKSWMKSISLPPQACKDRIVGRTAIIQGMRAQWAIKRIGAQSYDSDTVNRVLKRLDTDE